jgi:hypothetical protein
VVPRKAGGFIIFSVSNFQSTGSSDSSNPLKEDNLDGLSKSRSYSCQPVEKPGPKAIHAKWGVRHDGQQAHREEQ